MPQDRGHTAGPTARLSLAIVALAGLAVTAGCTSPLSAVAMREAMFELSDYGEPLPEEEHDLASEERSPPEAMPDEPPAPPPMTLEEAIDRAIERLADSGGLDEATRDMLLETLEATDPADWPVVIDSFAASLETSVARHRRTHDAAEEAGDSPVQQASAEVAVDGSAEPADPVPEVAPADAAADDEAEPQPESQHQLQPVPEPEPEPQAKPEPEPEPKPEPEPQATPEPEPKPEPEPRATPAEEPAAKPSAKPAAKPAAKPEPALPDEPLTEPAVEAAAGPTGEPDAAAAAVELPSGPIESRVAVAIRSLPVAAEPVLSDEERLAHLEAAVAEARRRASLEIRHACFASEVLAWGVVDRFDEARFEPGEEVIVYFELANLTAETRGDGHHTLVDTRLRLLDDAGACVHRWSFEPLAEVCPAARRDYFARYIVEIPRDAPPGPLQLEIDVTDRVGHKSATSLLGLEVAAGR